MLSVSAESRRVLNGFEFWRHFNWDTVYIL